LQSEDSRKHISVFQILQLLLGYSEGPPDPADGLVSQMCPPDPADGLVSQILIIYFQDCFTQTALESHQHRVCNLHNPWDYSSGFAEHC